MLSVVECCVGEGGVGVGGGDDGVWIDLVLVYCCCFLRHHHHLLHAVDTEASSVFMCSQVRHASPQSAPSPPPSLQPPPGRPNKAHVVAV
eukprot:3210247-Rhodomonas_salina.1